METNKNASSVKLKTPLADPTFEAIPDTMILVPQEIALLTGMSVESVRRWCRDGRISSYCYSGRYCVTGAGFKEFLQRSRVFPRKIREYYG